MSSPPPARPAPLDAGPASIPLFAIPASRDTLLLQFIPALLGAPTPVPPALPPVPPPAPAVSLDLLLTHPTFKIASQISKLATLVEIVLFAHSGTHCLPVAPVKLVLLVILTLSAPDAIPAQLPPAPPASTEIISVMAFARLVRQAAIIALIPKLASDAQLDMWPFFLPLSLLVLPPLLFSPKLHLKTTSSISQ